MTRATIVYVHGASDRGALVDHQVARIERQLALAGLEFEVIVSRWGDAVGADLSRIELALPGVEVTVAAPLALEEPMRPLDALVPAAEGLPKRSRRRGPDRQSDELLEICRAQVGAPGELVQLADGSVEPMAQACRRAATAVGRSAEYAVARASTVPDAALIDAVGRAVAATVGATAAAPLDVARTVQVRIAEAVLGAAVATIFAGYLGIDVGPDLKRWATDVLVPHRARLVREAGLGAADVVLYQRDGDPIRRFVRATMREAIGRGRPVVALGNSLGGIILVDALAEADAPRPDLLVTVGSQAPLLATFGALEPLGRPGSPAPFQPWLNIYDRRDLLGFVAGPVWPDQPGIVDHEVDLGIGFPDSHGPAYLGSADVFAAIAQQLAGNGPALGTRRRFAIADGDLSLPTRLVLGADRHNSYVDVDGTLRARLGRIEIATHVGNIAGWHSGPVRRGRSLLGLVRALLGGVAALGSGDAGITIDLRQPVGWFLFRISALELAVDDADGLAIALSALVERAPT